MICTRPVKRFINQILMVFNKSGVFIPILAIAIVIAIIFLLWPRAVAESGESFADCLVSKGVSMYGSDSCSVCEDQMRVFGDDYEKISYINCDFNKEECDVKGISVYPVWAKGNHVLLGLQSLEMLSDFSGCGL